MNVEIAQRLAERRKQAGLSQEALAAYFARLAQEESSAAAESAESAENNESDESDNEEAK